MAISPLHLLRYFIKPFKGERKKKKPCPHPSCEGHWFILPVTNITFTAQFCLLFKKKKK